MELNITNLKAILFDMDGTLIDSEPLHEKAFFSMLSETSYQFDFHTLSQRFRGQTDIEVFKAINLEKPGTFSNNLDSLIDEKNQRMIKLLENVMNEQIIIEGVYDTLKKLSGMNIKMALVSASEEKIVNVLLAKTGLASFFRVILHRSSTYLSKPSPSPYFKAMRELKVKSNQTLIFEDSITGVTSALDSGAKVIRVKTESNDQELTKFNHLETIANFNQLQF